jgi:hypothetical protein
MTDRGLRGVSNPSALFLSQHEQQVAGSCVLVTQEGTRPLLVEIQALVDEAHSPSPRRLSVGLEQNRLAMLLAVLHRHAGIACFDQDVFVNAVGGVRIGEPAADLAVLLAIVSSLRNRPLPKKLIAFGEIGLAGEIRPAPRGQERLKEAAKLGFTQALIPKANAPKQPIKGIEVIALERVEQAVDKCGICSERLASLLADAEARLPRRRTAPARPGAAHRRGQPVQRELLLRPPVARPDARGAPAARRRPAAAGRPPLGCRPTARKPSRLGLRVIGSVSFPSMTTLNGASHLADIKAVEPGYPLRGSLRTAPALNQPDAETQETPARGTVWLDERLTAALEAKVGDVVRLGNAPASPYRRY